MPVTIQDILNQSTYILDAVKLFGFHNPRIVRLSEPDDNELHLLVDEETSEARSLKNALEGDLQFKLNCIVFIDRDADLNSSEIKRIYRFPEERQQIEKDFAGVEFEQRNQDFVSSTKDQYQKNSIQFIKEGLLKKRPYTDYSLQQEAASPQKDIQHNTFKQDKAIDKVAKTIDKQNGVHVNGNGLKPS